MKIMVRILVFSWLLVYFSILENDVNFREHTQMESSKETGYQAQDGPILCVNNCGFFGSPTTMNMCSKCHKDMILKQQQAKLAASSIENLVNGKVKFHVLADPVNAEGQSATFNVAIAQHATEVPSGQNLETKPKEGPNRCMTCRKRVGLTGFECRCGHLFCSVHRYSDKHDCQFDYRSTGRDAIAKANPVVKAEKLGKI